MENYLEKVYVALDIANVDLLTALWKESAFFSSSQRDVVRNTINEALPFLVQKHNLSYEGKDFVHYVREIYDKHVITSSLEKPDAFLIQYLKEGGWQRAQAVATGLEELPKEALLFSDENSSLLGEVLYWIFARGRDQVYIASLFCAVAKKTKPLFLQRFVEMAKKEDDMRVIEDVFTIMEFQNSCEIGEHQIANLLQKADLLLTYWKYCLDCHLAKEGAYIFTKKDYLFYGIKRGNDDLAYLPYIISVISHKDCSAETKRDLVRDIFNRKRDIYLSWNTYPSFLDFPYDHVFHHFLIHNLLLESTVRGKGEKKNLAEQLITKFGYDTNFDPYYLEKAVQIKKLNSILSKEEKVVIEEEEDNWDQSYTSENESTDSEEYGSDLDWSTEGESSEEYS